MTLPNDAELDRLAEALLIEGMDLSPEVRVTVSILLDNLRWFRMLCNEESKTFDELTPEFLIYRITGHQIDGDQLVQLRKEAEARLASGDLLKSRTQRRARAQPTKRST